MGSSPSRVESRAAGVVGVDRPTALLAVGDAAVVAGVLLLGELSHGVAIFDVPVHVSKLVGAFVVGWFLVAGVLGIYDDRSWDLVPAIRVTTGTWLGAANLGLLARGSPWLSGGTTWPFPLVITGFVLVALLVWRVGVVAFVRARSA